MSIEFAQPWFFLTLLALPLLALGQRRSLAAFTPAQRRACLLLRSIILVCLALSLAGARVFLPSSDVAVVFAVDDSASVAPEARVAARDFVSAALAVRGPAEQAGVVGFAGEARVWQPVAPGASLAEWPRLEQAKATDIATAMHFGSALFPAGHARRIVLLSDGNQTRGKACRPLRI